MYTRMKSEHTMSGSDRLQLQDLDDILEHRGRAGRCKGQNRNVWEMRANLAEFFEVRSTC